MRGQMMEVRFRGLNTKADPKSAPAGTLDSATNVYAVRGTGPEGTFELVKRDGFGDLTANIDNTSVGAGSSIASGKRFGVYGDEMLIGDGKWLHSYSSSLNKWRVRGRMSVATATVTKILGAAGASARQNVDMAYAGGIYVLTVFGGGSGVFKVYVIDSVTGQVMARNAGTALDASTPFEITGQQPRLAVIGTTVYIVYHNGAAGIVCQTISAATPTTLSVGATLVSDAHATLRYDVTVDTTNSKILLAYRTAGAAIKRIIVNADLSTGASSSFAYDPDSAVGWLQHDYGDGNAYLAICGATAGCGVTVFTLTATTMAQTASAQCDAAVTNARNLTGCFNSGPIVLWEIPNATTSRTVIRYRSGATATADDFCRSVGLAGKMVKIASGRWMVPVAFEDPTQTQRSLYLLEYDGQVPGTPNTNGSVSIAGFLLNGDGAGLTETQSLLPNVAVVSATQYVIPAPTLEESAISNIWGVVRCDVTIGNSVPGVNYAGSHIFPGAVGLQYDGSMLSEMGFMYRPPKPTLAQAAGGSLTATSTYQYVLVYRWRDRHGRLWRSAPSDVSSITLTAGNQTVNLTAETLRVTMKAAKFNYNVPSAQMHAVEIEVYRTAGNGSVFRLRSVLGNDVTNDTNTLADTSADTTIAAREKLYTEGEVSNGTPPCPRVLHVIGSRLWAVVNDADLWFTKEPKEGYGAEFAAAFRLPLDPGPGRVTGLAGMDGRTLVGRATRWSVISGSGPDARGEGMYDFPTVLPGKTGPTDQNGIVETQDGVFYASDRGIHQLDRGLSEQYIGAGVESYNSQTVTASVSTTEWPHARFSMSGGDVLVYDWLFKQWTVSTGIGTCVAAGIWRGAEARLRSTGVVTWEVPGQAEDTGVVITSSWETTWISPFGIGGKGRLKAAFILCEGLGAHTLRCTFRRNFVTTADTAQNLTGSVGNYKAEARPIVQRCTSIKIAVQDVLASATRGVKWTGFSLLLKPQDGMTTLPASSRMT